MHNTKAITIAFVWAQFIKVHKSGDTKKLIINNKRERSDFLSESQAKSPACGMSVKLYDVKLLLILQELLHLLTHFNKTHILKTLPGKGMTEHDNKYEKHMKTICQDS